MHKQRIKNSVIFPTVYHFLTDVQTRNTHLIYSLLHKVLFANDKSLKKMQIKNSVFVSRTVSFVQ